MLCPKVPYMNRVADSELDDLAESVGAKLIIQFGSTVMGKEHWQSDLDIAVLLGRQPTLEDLSTSSTQLQKQFPGRDVDIAMLDSADPLLAWRVATEGRLLWGSRRAFHEWKMYAYRRYQDHRPYLALERDFVKRQIWSR